MRSEGDDKPPPRGSHTGEVHVVVLPGTERVTLLRICRLETAPDAPSWNQKSVRRQAGVNPLRREQLPYNAQRSAGECRPNGIEHFPPRREHAQGCQGAAINHCLSVYQHLEFTVPAPHHLNLRAQFATKPRRHPDGVQTGYSICAVANGNASHVPLLNLARSNRFRSSRVRESLSLLRSRSAALPH